MKVIKQQPVTVGQKLVSALTKDQITRLLSAVFDRFDDQKLNELSEKVDQDIATTLSQLLAAKKPEAKPPLPKRIVSDQKYIAEWEKLWSKWEDIANEAGREQGKYIYQEHHWEHPYFTGDDLSEDLEQIAEEMLPRIEKICSLEAADDDVFEQGLHDIESGVHSLPEWLGADHDGFGLGNMTTQCLLKWEWFVARSQKETPIEFIERIVAIEDALTLACLHDGAFINFFMALPENIKRQIYEHLTAHRDEARWAERLDSAYSKWHQFYHALAESFSPETYLENCREMLRENWRYGLPLVENLLKKKAYAEAGKIIEQAFSSYLHYRTNESWKPETSLLIDFMRYAYQAAEKEIIKLLKHWAVITEKLGKSERAAALKFQLVTYEKPYKWDAVIEVYKEIRDLPYARTISRLFDQWQLFIFNHGVEGPDETKKEMNDSWIHWLIATGLDEAKSKRWFAQKVENWLEHLSQNPPEFKKQHYLVYALTKDLAERSSLSKQYPKLFDLVLNHAYMDRQGAPIRREWLAKMQGEKFIPRLIECWQKNIATLVPNPAHSSGSNYEDHARWLAVVNELNPAACGAIIQRWMIDHKMRRNLWLAIKKQRLLMEEKKPEKLFVGQ